MPATSPEPLLAAEDLRVDVSGVPACDGLSLRTTGERVLVLGASRALFEATCGLLPARRGRLAVLGTDAAEAARARVVAGAALDPPLPAAWTPLEYVTWSARLSGQSKVEARAQAKASLELVQLGPMATTPLAQLVVHARRATVLAAALATGARVIALDDPLGGLPEEIARAWARILVKALAERAWIAFAPRVPLTSPLALHADEALVVDPSRVAARGAPAELAAAERRFLAKAVGPVEALLARLGERGVRVELRDAGAGREQGSAELSLDLGDAMTTSELLGLCVEAEVVLTELRPMSRALA